ncbi:penicillinase repressor [Microbulbifer sp. A4B17]|uniref:BlaI/MecI/CopY family transcriptional regulator n=1 Tax=Microbulbifer sp. A4B17 TaxID=359370 RepID=UPI000D52B573|nr:BlaI/MecI/CopY family transcriptional regulator [Microbulbifer sp. A4B17]AWF82086.1 penicillinase repressor [Microbulbifer sp. A4B17]
MREIKPSPSELALLKALWKQKPLSARELHDRVKPELEWSYSSTRKTLDRMRDKSLVTQSEIHGIHVYSPTVDKVETLALYARDFAERVLELDGPLPVAMFAGSKLMSEEDIEELQAVLDAWPDSEPDNEDGK